MARMNVLADVVKGLKANIHAIDNMSPVSRVAVYIRAGSRYEPDAVPGISHFLRASSGLTTQESSIFGITRHVERHGACFKVTSDREYIVYRVDCLRDKLGYLLGFIDDTIHKPEFRSWELVDITQPRLKEELGRYKKNQVLVAHEAMHKAAFRGGLAHSMFIPEHQIEKINKHQLKEYVETNYVLERMSFVGLGTDPSELTATIEENFQLNNSKFNGVNGASRYIGGEARIQAGFTKTLMNFVYQGYPISDLKSNAVLDVIGSLLGVQKYVKYGAGAEKTLAHLLGSKSHAFKSSIININYTDTGLFGFSILGPNELMKSASKDAVKHFKQIMANLSEADLNNAKKVAKARALVLSEDHEAVFSSLGQRYAGGVIRQSPLDHVDKLTLKDVQAVVGSLLKSKPTVVSVGNPRYVPYLDEIDS